MIPYAWCTPDTNVTFCVKDTSIRKKLLETSSNDWGHLPTLEVGVSPLWSPGASSSRSLRRKQRHCANDTELREAAGLWWEHRVQGTTSGHEAHIGHHAGHGQLSNILSYTSPEQPPPSPQAPGRRC